MRRKSGWFRTPGAVWLPLGLLASCATYERAPVVERRPTPQVTSAPHKVEPKAAKEATPTLKPQDSGSQGPPPLALNRPQLHIVQKGDTLFSVARRYGINHYELGLWNGLQNVNAIREGQEIRLWPPAGNSGQVTVMPLGTDGQPPSGKSLEEVQNIPSAAMSTGNVVHPENDAPTVAKAQPPGQIDGLTDEQRPGADYESLQWVWPSNGKIASAFSDSTKGLVIAGSIGQAVYASADGLVSYIGNSLRGYGKMVVIKHNKTYLSVYAHNSVILVREGQTVIRGQKIAEMGNSDSEDGSVKLHFEIRRLGKPVDPLKYLPSERPS
jgi:lipoprotein NlpD